MTGPKAAAGMNGITLNWPLTGTILSVVAVTLAGGMWVGVTVTKLSGDLAAVAREQSQLKADLATAKIERAATDTRLRAVETSQTRSDTQMQSALAAIADIKAEQVEANRLLRQVLARLGVAAQ